MSPSKPVSRRRLLSVNFFPAFSPPSSGGELRLLNLYRALSQDHDITLITSADFGGRFEEIWHTPTMRELRFPKDAAWHRAFKTLADAGVEGDLSGLAFSLAVGEPTCALRKKAQEIAAVSDIVIHEFPYSEPIFRDEPPRCEIYNSHNFEIGLISSIISGHGTGRCFQRVLRLEANLVARARRVFATSEADAEQFRLLYGVPHDRIRYCPNGYSEAELAPIESTRRQRVPGINDRPKLLFMGSGHPPNVDAAKFLITLATDLTEVDIVVAGKVCQSIVETGHPSNLRCIGVVSEMEKHRLIESADIFLNPVVDGSGTSLKAIEALASFLPMIATPEGVRGLSIESGKQAIVCDRTDFAQTIRDLMFDRQRLADMAECGEAHARAHFTWSAIARRLGDDLNAVLRKQRPSTAARPATVAKRPLLIALNDYAIGKTRFGGSVRMAQMHRSVGADVILIAFGNRFDISIIDPGVLQITLGKSAAHRAFGDSVNEGQSISVNDIVSALFVASYELLAELLSHLAERCDAIIFEHCYMAPALDFLRQARPSVPVVYNAHNVEASMKEAMLSEHPLRAPLVQFVQDIEQRLAAAADLIVTCTDADAAHFRGFKVPILIIPNGCSTIKDLASKNEDGAVRIGFLGSAHPPNVDAAWYIITVLAPLFEDAVFELVGGVCEAVSGPFPPNVVMRGAIDDRQKTIIMRQWDLALNPVEMGGGSSLKLPDYMAHGLASISTPLGARGFPVIEKHLGSVADREALPDELRRLIDDKALRIEFGTNAYRYATVRLNWSAVTTPLRKWLERTHKENARPEPASKPSLLIVTYRYTEPPLGGAEEYLIEVMRWLRPQFKSIELVATDVVGPLTNRHHFGCGFTAGTGGANVLGEMFDSVRLFRPDPVPEKTVLSTAQRLERARRRHETKLYDAFIDSIPAGEEPILLSGFYWPENHSGRIVRWTAPEFDFLVPGKASVFRFAGWAPRPMELVVSSILADRNGDHEIVELHHQQIQDDFVCTLAFDGPATGAQRHIVCRVDEHLVATDHRALGIILHEASTLNRQKTHLAERRGLQPLVFPLSHRQANLAADLEGSLRTGHFEHWLDRLHALAKSRSDEEESDFASIRGPHSEAMQDWITENASRFDVILVQGIPFDTVPRTVETLRKLKDPPRIVTLPHFHGDDTFYYWRRYLDSFARSDKTLFFSASFAGRLGDPARNAVVAGGGVKFEEEASAPAAARFHQLHQSSNPFFICLGRKTQSKGYARIVQAIGKLRATDHAIDLVMIGPDDDKASVEAEGVYYYGRQPREIVLGALSACLGLITMSNSESFGIVLCEAWRFHKPVIANRACYSFRELVADRQTGLLVSSDLELVSAMRELAVDPALRLRLGTAGFERVMSGFTWQNVAEQIHRVLIDEA